jgi:two-component system OmpR family response regulator
MPKRVLIVDDEPDVLDTLAAMVASGGYEVVTRSDFEEARRYLTEMPPDILITDVRLGAYNGLQLAVVLRSTCASCPIVVLSAFDDPTLRAEAAHVSAIFLAKPVSKKELLVCIAGLGRASVWTAPTSKHVH